MAEIEISFDLDRMKKFLILGFLVVVLALEINLTTHSPIAFGDEGFHVSTSRYIGTEMDFSASTPLFGSVFSEERFNRAPFWNLIEASFYMLFGFNENIVKVLVPFISFLTGLTIYTFLKRLYSENVGIVAAAVAVTIPSFVTYSVFFYTTVPYVFFFSIGFLSFLTAIKTNSKKYWILSGLFSGIALFTNIAGLFMPILVTVMGLIHFFKSPSFKSARESLKTYGLVALIIGLIALPWAARNIGLFYVEGCDSIPFIIEGICKDQIAVAESTTEADFVGREASGGTSDSILNIGVINYLTFAYGFISNNSVLSMIGLAFVPFSVIAGIVLVGKRREMSDVALIVSIVLFAGVFYQFGGLLEGRSEDTARYLLSLAPLIGIFAGTFWASVRKDDHRLNGVIVLAVIIMVMGLTMYGAYTKLYGLKDGGRIVYNGLDAVKQFSPAFFQACDWIKQNTPEDSILFTLHTYPTRYNCDRAASWELPVQTDKRDMLLSSNISIMRQVIDRNGMDYIFVQKFGVSTEPLARLFPVSFVKFVDSHNETFQKVYENGPPIDQCVQQGGCDGTIVYEILE